jgi:hypothetical protein
LHHANTLHNTKSFLLSEIGSFPAKRALRPGAIFASIATWDVLPSLASADAFRRLASYSALSYNQPLASFFVLTTHNLQLGTDALLFPAFSNYQLFIRKARLSPV